MAEPLVIVGAGGFGREVVALVRTIRTPAGEARWDVAGVVDDDPSDADRERLAQHGLVHLGGVEEAAAGLPGASYVVAVAGAAARRAIVARADAAGLRAARVVHHEAVVGEEPSVALGEGAILSWLTLLPTDIVVGRHVQMNAFSYVGHDSTIGDYVTFSPRVGVSGGCTIGDDVFLGTGVVVLPGVTIGAGASVAASACVVRDVEPGAVVRGVPAR